MKTTAHKTLARVVAVVGLACLGLSFSGCSLGQGYRAPVMTPPGFIYQETSAPLTYDVNETPVNTANSKSASKSTRFVSIPFTYGLLSFGWESADIASIAREGNINEVSHADYRAFNILGIYREFTVTVYGN